MTTSDWRWEVQIRGALSDLEHLARHFTSAHASVFREERDDSYLYHSDAFEVCETSEKVLATADDDLAVLSGILKFVRDSHEPVLTDAVHKRHADGRRDVFVHIREGIQARAEFGEVTVTVTDAQGNQVQQPTPPPRTVTISALTMQDAAVTKAMRLFAMTIEEAVAYANYVLHAWLASKGIGELLRPTCLLNPIMLRQHLNSFASSASFAVQ